MIMRDDSSRTTDRELAQAIRAAMIRCGARAGIQYSECVNGTFDELKDRIRASLKSWAQSGYSQRFIDDWEAVELYFLHANDDAMT